MEPSKFHVAFAIAVLWSVTSTTAKPSYLRYFSVDEPKTSQTNARPPLQASRESNHGDPDKEFVLFKEAPGNEVEEVLPVPETMEDSQYRLSYADYEETWSKYNRKHNRVHKSWSEEKTRSDIFMKNVKHKERHNWNFHKGLTSYWMDINQFSDRTEEEMTTVTPLRDMPTTMAGEGTTYQGHHETPRIMNLSSAVDWRDKGYVTPVKDQGSKCGSCWAFSALIDCSSENLGCSGGSVYKTFAYLAKAGGLQNETTYPYEEKENDCRYHKGLAIAKIRSYKRVQSGDEQALQHAVETIGPISVAIYASSRLHHYAGGVFEDSYCNSEKHNHDVLVVGYNTSRSQDYWTIKNSWGSEWGEDGYFRMVRNQGNMCQIASAALYPLV